MRKRPGAADTRGRGAKRLARRVLELYVRHHVPRTAAALSYFLMLSVFPALLCLSYMLGGLFPEAAQFRAALSGLLPRGAADTLTAFLRGIPHQMGQGMLLAALAGMLTSCSAAYRTVDGFMGELRSAHRFDGPFRFVFSFCFSVFFLTAMYVAALLILTGKWFLELADRRLLFMNISEAWVWGRFVLLFLLLFVVVALIYRLTAPRGRHTRQLPGALAAASVLVAVSLFFSAFIDRSARYPLLYGSLAGVIVMMVWLYVSGAVLLTGNVLNVALEKEARSENGER